MVVAGFATRSTGWTTEDEFLVRFQSSLTGLRKFLGYPKPSSELLGYLSNVPPGQKLNTSP